MNTPKTHEHEIRELHEIIRTCYENMYRKGFSESSPIMKAIREKVAIPIIKPTIIDWHPTEANKEKWLKMLDFNQTQL